MTELQVVPFEGSDPALAATAFTLNQRAFNSPDDAAARWIASLAHCRCVGAWDGGTLAGFARVKPYRQFFGGRDVPMAGVASVAVAPEHRGRGLAARLTAALLPLARDAGLPLSVLYPASTALYRRLGWEQAGQHLWLRVPARSLRSAGRPDGVVLRPGTEADAGPVAECYEWLCRQSNGLLARTGPFFDSPAATARNRALTVAEQDGRVAGYAITRLTGGGRQPLGLTCWDVVGTTGAAQRALWWLLGSYASVVDTVEVQTTPDAGLLLQLPEPDLTVATHDRWMARLVDAPAAVAARGWPAGVAVTADLELVDELAPWQAGRWRLRVDGGAAELVRGGSGAVRIGPGALAALYSSHTDPWTLRRAGLLDASDEVALAALGTAFGGPQPHLLDYF